MSRAVMQQALEALEWNYNTDLNSIAACEVWAKMLNETITALRQALAEPQTTHWEGCEAVHPECRKQEPDGISWLKRDSGYFTAPTPRKPLTDEEIDRVTDQQWAQNNHKPIYAAHRAYARAIERAHGIGGGE